MIIITNYYLLKELFCLNSQILLQTKKNGKHVSIVLVQFVDNNIQILENKKKIYR